MQELFMMQEVFMMQEGLWIFSGSIHISIFATQTFSFSFFPCSADHERDWPPCKVVFFGLATNALNVRNNNNDNPGLLTKVEHIQHPEESLVGGWVRNIRQIGELK